MLGLVLSGVTAFPLKWELDALAASLEPRLLDETGFGRWIVIVRDGLTHTYSKYPWIAYGTDWLAFAHIAIAVFFIGPLIDPVRNAWVLQAGFVACALVIPLALVCGAVRNIPFGWRMIDCSFGVFGALPLYYCLRLTRQLEKNRP